MTHDEAFLQEIIATPHDDAPRLVYADWLEDHGQSDRAELIRVQCETARRAAADPGYSRSSACGALSARALELLDAHWKEWIAPLRALVGPNASRMGEGWLELGVQPESIGRFRRGFVERLTLDAVTFIQRAEELYRLAPVRHLRVWGGGGNAAALAACPFLANLTTLDFADYHSAPLSASDAQALAYSPHLRRLTFLSLNYNNVGDPGVLALLVAPWLSGLRNLNLDDCGLGDQSAFALAACPKLRTLEGLSLCANGFSGAGQRALRASAHLPNLRTLRFVHS